MEIIQGVHQIKVPLPGAVDSMNVYLIEGTQGNLLIDTGLDTSECFGALRDALKFSGFGFKDITVIAATHVHPHHFGLASKLKQLSGAKVALGDIEAKFIDTRYTRSDALVKQVKQLLISNGVPEGDATSLAESPLAIKEFVSVVKPDIILKDGDKITVASQEFKVVLSPGHSPGHICLYEPKRKMFFSGDHLLPDVFPHIGYHPQSGENPLADFFKSIEALGKLDINFIFPGHGSVFSGFKLRLQELHYYHDQRQREVSRIIESDTKNAYQVASELPWAPAGDSIPFNKLSAFDKRLAVMETLAELKLMLIQGKAQKVVKENVDQYFAGG